MSRQNEVRATNAALKIKKGATTMLLDATMEMGLADDLKTSRLLKFIHELSCVHQGVSLWNALCLDQYHILLKYQGKTCTK